MDCRKCNHYKGRLNCEIHEKIYKPYPPYHRACNGEDFIPMLCSECGEPLTGYWQKICECCGTEQKLK